ncbi:DMT family transporter [Marimonas lutisalis]|uniref:DMT family transporter n=1 Tax=Marimonas lutisalis TaxID=2545756 RepID=UPI0019603374|nr:DMT family transporter [Marimonas lutisalis]
MNRPLGLIAAALTGVQVGLALVVTRAIATEVGPMQIALLRYAVGVLVLLPFFLRGRFAPVRRRDLAPVLALGVVQFGVLVALLNASVQRISAGQASVLFATFPLLTMAVAAALGQERLSVRKLSGGALSVVGVALCLGVSHMPSEPAGVALALGAALAGAVCAVLYRPYLPRYPTLQIGTLAMIAAVLALLPASLLEAPLGDIAGFAGHVWGAMLFIGLSSGAGYVLWLTALRHAAPTEATLLLSLSPVVAAATGWLWLGERVGWTGSVGIALVLAGIALALTGRRPVA